VNRIQAERIEWFEGFAIRKLGLRELRVGVSDFEIRRERIRAAIMAGKLADTQPGKTGDTRSWGELYRAVYGLELI
jgi:hypothetical protein